MKLSPARRAELLNELRLRVLFKDKVLCARYGISRRTLTRLQAEALEQPLAQKTPDTLHIVCFTGSGQPKRVKAA
jgi:hypothetical protein